MSHAGRSDSFAPINLAALIGLAGVAFGDNTVLLPVRVEGDAAKMATQSYKFCWSAVELSTPERIKQAPTEEATPKARASRVDTVASKS